MDEIKLSFEDDELSFGDYSLSFGNSKLSFEDDTFDTEVPVETNEVVTTETATTTRWITAQEAEAVVTWLRQIISYNLRNDINTYAKDLLSKVNSSSISYEALHENLEKLKNTFNAVAKRRNRR